MVFSPVLLAPVRPYLGSLLFGLIGPIRWLRVQIVYQGRKKQVCTLIVIQKKKTVALVHNNRHMTHVSVHIFKL